DPMRVSWIALASIIACSKQSTPQAQLRYGPLMVDVARRFELAGRSASAGRFELASFEVGEIEEIFADDLPRAEVPREGNFAAVPALADAFRKTHPPELKRAANARDRDAFASAFERTAATCNACHQTSGHAFIEIPSALGKPVPNIDPVDGPK